MPCTDGGVPYTREDTTRVNLNARVACDALSLIERTNPDLISELRAETQAWWHAHKEADRIRLQREREASDREALRNSARSKLTPAERKALGI